MLSLILIWGLLSLLCFTFGTAILNLIGGNTFTKDDDRAIACQWLGLIFLSNLFLFVSLFSPLNWISAVVTIGILLGFGFITRLLDIKDINTVSKLSNSHKISVLIALVVSALLSAHQVDWLDTHGYQYPVIKWLANYGTVKGLGLLHIRFAHMPTATTINALFDHGIWAGRTSTIFNGFITSLLLGQFTIIIQRLFYRQMNGSDWFMICFVPFTYISASEAQLLRSANPDLAVMYLAGFLVWLVLVCYESNYEIRPSFSCVAVYLGVGAMTLKFNALPLALGAILWFIYYYYQRIRIVVKGLLLSGLMLVPCFLYGWTTSGCPLFPAGLGCLQLPWSLSATEVSNYSRYIYEFNLNFTIEQFTTHPAIVKGLLLLIPAIIYICWYSIRRNKKEFLWLLLWQICSLLFIARFAPALRFGIGYLGVIVSLAISLFISEVASIIRLSILGYLVYSMLILPSLNQLDFSNWLLPAYLPAFGQILVKQALNFNYYLPINKYTLCSATELPCGSNDLDATRVKVIDKNQGIGSGFARESP
jgi:hypothetical protein